MIPRSLLSAAAACGVVVVILSPLLKAERSIGWRPAGNMSSARAFHASVALPNGQVLATGGINGFAESTAELYGPVTGAWALAASMRFARKEQTATLLLDGRVLVAGGVDVAGAA